LPVNASVRPVIRGISSAERKEKRPGTLAFRKVHSRMPANSVRVAADFLDEITIGERNVISWHEQNCRVFIVRQVKNGSRSNVSGIG